MPWERAADIDIPDMELDHPFSIHNDGLDTPFFSAKGVCNAASEVDEHWEV
jgi:hypothetical protein